MIRGSLDLLDRKHLHGTFELGRNATGVIDSSIHFLDDGEVIIQDTMPGEYVQQCMDEVARLSDNINTRRPGGFVSGRIPLPLYHMWRKAWEAGPKQHGVLWRAFLMTRLTDRDYRKLWTGKK
jgi:hypothetical protein